MSLLTEVPPEAIQIVKKYEGLHKLLPSGILESYLCPAGVWTIGRGSTFLKGHRVVPGQTCTLQEADEQFKLDIENAASFVTYYVKARLTRGQFGALVSFVHNVGSGRFSSSTLLRRINNGESVKTACIAELPRWVHDENRNVLQGLVSRRQSELALIVNEDTAVTGEQVMSFRVANAAKFDRNQPWQRSAWQWLYQNAPEKSWDAMQQQLPPSVLQGFATRFRNEPAQVVTPRPPASNEIILKGIPRFTQRDSAWIAQRDRKCYSSTNAMLVEYLKPGTLPGPNGDDKYFRRLITFGDTTDWGAQQKTLESFGIKARLVQNATWDLVRRQLEKNFPVPYGYVHRGPISAPWGSGHWCIGYGISSTHTWISDPWGEPDLVTGNTLSQGNWQGKVTQANFGRRWMVEPNGDSFRYAPGKGWIIVVDSVS
jgi:GH24 family phage-related lysozyme (muramidase)